MENIRESIVNALLEEHTTGKITGKEKQATSIQLSVLYNKSDGLGGWNGDRHAFTVHYMHHPLEHGYNRLQYSHALLDNLTPRVAFQVRKMRRKIHYYKIKKFQIRTYKYLGKPFTECEENTGYTKGFCQFSSLQKHIVDVCGCIAEDVPFLRNVIPNPDIEPCTFFELATCLASISVRKN